MTALRQQVIHFAPTTNCGWNELRDAEHILIASASNKHTSHYWPGLIHWRAVSPWLINNLKVNPLFASRRYHDVHQKWRLSFGEWSITPNGQLDLTDVNIGKPSLFKLRSSTRQWWSSPWIDTTQLRWLRTSICSLRCAPDDVGPRPRTYLPVLVGVIPKTAKRGRNRWKTITPWIHKFGQHETYDVMQINSRREQNRRLEVRVENRTDARAWRHHVRMARWWLARVYWTMSVIIVTKRVPVVAQILRVQFSTTVRMGRQQTLGVFGEIVILFSL